MFTDAGQIIARHILALEPKIDKVWLNFYGDTKQNSQLMLILNNIVILFEFWNASG